MSCANPLPSRCGGASMGHAPPAENYLGRNALLRRARPPDLLLRLSLQPLDRDQRRSSGERGGVGTAMSKMRTIAIFWRVDHDRHDAYVVARQGRAV
jgi:hypothetical protein